MRLKSRRAALALSIILIAATFQVQAEGSSHNPMQPFPRTDENRLGVQTKDLFGHRLISTEGAETHIVVRSHGYPQTEDTFSAISSFTGGCNAQNTHPTPCEDQQFAIHTPR